MYREFTCQNGDVRYLCLLVYRRKYMNILFLNLSYIPYLFSEFQVSTFAELFYLCLSLLWWKAFSTGPYDLVPYISGKVFSHNFPPWKKSGTLETYFRLWKLPSGKHTNSYWKIAIYSEFSHKKRRFSIVMLVYQRVYHVSKKTSPTTPGSTRIGLVRGRERSARCPQRGVPGITRRLRTGTWLF